MSFTDVGDGLADAEGDGLVDTEGDGRAVAVDVTTTDAVALATGALPPGAAALVDGVAASNEGDEAGTALLDVAELLRLALAELPLNPPDALDDAAAS